MFTNTISTAEVERLKALTVDEQRLLALEVDDESAAILRHDTPTKTQEKRLAELIDTRDILTNQIKKHELRELIASGDYYVEGGNGYQGHVSGLAAGNSRGAQPRDGAMRVLDAAVRAKTLPEHAAAKVERLVSDGPDRDRSVASKWACATGDPHYRTAFAKMLADPERGHMLWTREEQAAYQNATEVRTAMAIGTTATGGALLPLSLDPAILLTSDGSASPLRRICRVVQTVSNTWQGVTSAGATSEWKTEGSQAADGAPSVATAPIPVFFGDTFVPYSYEVGQDALSFLDSLATVMRDSADQLMTTAYTVGNGTTEPRGLVTALVGTASEINTTGSEAIVASDAYALQAALPPRFSANAQWVANINVINAFSQFETTNGSLKFPEIRGGQLLRKPLNELSTMDGAIDAAATANNYVLVYGDFSQMIIVDRIGSQLSLIPDLFGANGRPTGQRGAFLWFRTGSDVPVINAFRMLDVPTAA